jgi:hypothetical protein
MVVAYTDIQTRMLTTFTTTSSPTQAEVTALIAKMRLSFENENGAAPDEAAKDDFEIIELMTVLAIAKGLWASGKFAAGIQTPDGTTYQFSTKMISDLENELEQKRENAGYVTADQANTASFEYDW